MRTGTGTFGLDEGGKDDQEQERPTQWNNYTPPNLTSHQLNISSKHELRNSSKLSTVIDNQDHETEEYDEYIDGKKRQFIKNNHYS